MKTVIILLSFILVYNNARADENRIVIWQRPDQFPLWFSNFENWKSENPGDWIVSQSEFENSEQKAVDNSLENSIKYVDDGYKLIFQSDFIRAYKFISGDKKIKETEIKYICYTLFKVEKILQPYELEINDLIKAGELNFSKGYIHQAYYCYKEAERLRVNNNFHNIKSSKSILKDISDIRFQLTTLIETVKLAVQKNDLLTANQNLIKIQALLTKYPDPIYLNMFDGFNEIIKKTGKNINDLIDSIETNFKNRNFSNMHRTVIALFNAYEKYNQFDFDIELKKRCLEIFNLKVSEKQLAEYLLIANIDIIDKTKPLISSLSLNLDADLIVISKSDIIPDFLKTNYLNLKIESVKLSDDFGLTAKDFTISGEFISFSNIKKIVEKKVRITAATDDHFLIEAQQELQKSLKNLINSLF